VVTGFAVGALARFWPGHTQDLEWVGADNFDLDREFPAKRE